MRQNDDGKTVASMDILFPKVYFISISQVRNSTVRILFSILSFNYFFGQIGELVGGGQREERLEYLENKMDELMINKESYWWYLDLRRYGTG